MIECQLMKDWRCPHFWVVPLLRVVGVLVILDGLVKSLHPHNGLKTNGIQDESA